MDSLSIVEFNNVSFSYSKKISGMTLKNLFIKGYEDKTKEVFTELSLKIDKSKRYALVGPNGAGKSSIALMIMKKIFPDNGTIVSRGRVLTLFSDSDNIIENINVKDFIKLYLNILWPKCTASEITNIVSDVLDFSGLGELQEKSIESLSKGMRQKLLLSIYTAKEIDLLILDESLSGVEESFNSVFKTRIDRCLGVKGTLILIDHNKSTRDFYCDSLISLEDIC